MLNKTIKFLTSSNTYFISKGENIQIYTKTHLKGNFTTNHVLKENNKQYLEILMKS